MIRPEDILNLTRRRPFAPFRIHMSDGSSFEVRHPELAMVLQSRVVIGVPPADPERPPKELQFCSILHITRLEELPAAG